MPLNIDWQQILLHLLNFTVLFAVCYFLLYKPVKQFMDKRVEYYKKTDEKAKANLTDSEKAKEEYERKLKEVQSEITEQKMKADADIKKANEIKIKQAEEKAAKIISDAEKSIESDREKMIREAQKEITDMVANAAEKLVKQSSTVQAFDDFLDAAERDRKDE